MKTNWSTPKTNIFAALIDLQKCMSYGTRAKIIRTQNEKCEHPIKDRAAHNDFRRWEFMVGHLSTVEKIKADTSMSDFEKHLSLNYVNVYGEEQAMKRYYETGVLSKENFKSAGRSHLVNVDDLIKFLEDSGDKQRAEMYRREYRTPDYEHVSHFFDFYRIKREFNYWEVKKLKVWAIATLDDNEKVPFYIRMLGFLKYIPKKDVLQMPDYKLVTYRIGAVTNGYNIQFHIPKKFSFK